MKGFTGFPGGPVRFTAVPDLFWADLLPQIDDLAELKVTLHCLWRLTRKEGSERYLSRDELAQDELLLGGLGGQGLPPERVLDDALERATARGSLLRVEVRLKGQPQHWYFVNTARARALVTSLVQGERAAEGMVRPAEPVAMPRERPEIFTLYEQNVGLLQPIIAEELRDAAATYPAAWIEDAFRAAAARNVRNWRYIRAILERWAREGREYEQPERRVETRHPADTRRRFRDELE